MMKQFTIIVLLGLLFGYCECRVDTEQYIDIWFNSCEGKPNYTWTDNADRILPKNTTGTIGYKANGLWAITICLDENCKSSSKTTMSGNGKDGCSTSWNSVEYFKVQAKRFGNLNLNKTELWLYPEDSFQGVPTIVKEDGMKGINMTALSYFWTGEKDWQITYQNGTQECLKSGVKKTIQFWLMLSFSEIQIQDASVGCNT